MTLRHEALFFLHAPDALAVLRRDGTLIRVNPAFMRLLAAAEQDVVNRSLVDLLVAADRSAARTVLAGLRPGEPAAFAARTTRSGSAVRLEWRLVLDVEHALVYATARESAGERTLDERQRLESVGRLAGGIAHDFNNILTTILGASDFVSEALGPDHPAAADVERIRSAARRAADLTRKLLAFSRQHVLAPRIVVVDGIVADTADLLRRALGDDVRVEMELNAGPGRVRLDPGQLQQVLMNLALNARDAMPEGGMLTIRTSTVSVEGRARVQIEVQDSGTGMQDGVLARIFEPFFTTKEPGRGSGLGLSVAWGIIEQSDGTIQARSEPGRGTTVTITLPLAEHTAEPGEASRGEPKHAGATILLVEDDNGVRDWLTRVLVHAGFRVIVAAHPDEAIELSTRARDPIDLLVTDLTMPGMGGRELHERLAAAGRVQRVLFVSGHTEDDALRRAIAEGNVSFLEKPFSAEAMLAAIRGILG